MADFHDVHPPVRSISLPIRLQPDSIKVVSELKKLKSCPPGSCTAEEMRAKITSLADIFVRVQEMLTSPLTQKVFSKPGTGELVEGALDQSITVIDACGHARDLLSALREQVREVQCSVRRSRGGTNFSGLEREIKSFMSFRKKAKKEAMKYARELKKVVDRNPTSMEGESSSSHLQIVVQVLEEVNDIAGSVLRALLESLSAAKVNTRWSLVSRLMLPSNPQQQRLGSLAEVESADSALCSILRSKNDVEVDLKTTQKMLEALEICTLRFEEGLERLFKCLIQYRVSLLNVLTS